MLYNNSLGSKWLYLKIYTGKLSANKLLADDLNQIILKLSGRNMISKWFFIRYEDPDFHIRFRIELFSKEDSPNVIELIAQSLNKHIESRTIWNIQIDTYQREIQRYGEENILDVEDMFFYDSMFVLKHLSEGNNLEWSNLQLAMFLLDFTFDVFEIDEEQKLSKVASILNGFQSEFHVNTIQKKKLNVHFKKNIIHPFKYNFRNSIDFKILRPTLEKRIQVYKEKARSINQRNLPEEQLNRIIFGLNHMTCNRLFCDRQRINEMICYDFLKKCYHYSANVEN